MYSNGISGSGIGDANVRFRMYLVVTVGITAFGSVLFWRAQLLVNSEYVEFPEHGQTVKKAKAAENKFIHISKELNERE